jgi:GT2 family glycosyltransferase
MEAARGKYFLLLNSDTLILDNCLAQCVDFLEQPAQASVGLLGCRLSNEDGSYQPSFYPFRNGASLWNYMISNNPVLYRLFGVRKKFAQKDAPAEVGDVSGAFMLLRRSVYEELKGFDPDFFLYCEETEWCRNRIGQQHKIIYYPHSSIIHFGGGSAPRDPLQVQAFISQGLFWYKTGWLPYIGFLLFNMMNILYFSCTAVFGGAEKRRWAQLQGNIFFKALPYFLKSIPNGGRAFGSRKSPLIYEGARNIFFAK